MISINSSNIKVQIWDTAGQERYRAVTSAYYRGSAGCVLVYDITNQKSYKNIEKWLFEIREHAPSNISIVLVGNKNDLSNDREILTSEAMKFAIRENLYFLETSALMATDTDTAFNTLINDIYEKKGIGSTNFLIKPKPVISTQTLPSKKCCS